MKRKNVLFLLPSILVLEIALVICAIISCFFDFKLALFQFVIAVVSTFFVVKNFHKKETLLYNSLSATASLLASSDRQALKSFTLPIVMTANTGEILWYNDSFRNDVIAQQDKIGEMIFDIIGNDVSKYFSVNDESVLYLEKYYRVFGVDAGYQETKVFYFVDNTKLKTISDEYALSRPCVMLLAIDNYEELMQNAKESEKSNILGQFDRILEEYIASTSGFLLKLKSDRFFAVIEERDMKVLTENRFSILEQVRTILANDTVPLTISIGVGRSMNSVTENEILARQGLEMALGRGGDQAVVKTDDEYIFYGGVSKGYEKSTKVKSRVISTALRKLVDESDNVVVMGHKFSDLDAVGAATAIACASREVGKYAVVAIDTDKTMARELVDYIGDSIPGLFVHPSAVLPQITDKTLLIIVDTHLENLLESVDIYKKCQTVAIIDHHRRNANFINEAVLSYHEPYASSASELVTEVLQYWAQKAVVGKMQAEALLAGIMLDTKNFIFKTGVRTFEASAYLRRRGADTTNVRKFLASSLDSYQRKIKIVSSAVTYKDCAVAVSDFTSDDLRVVAPQAADELLNVSGVKASFVIFEADGEINITARSMGDINVQIIMEQLGGGGHHTMAATQLKDTDVVSVNALLLQAIDSYNSK